MTPDSKHRPGAATEAMLESTADPDLKLGSSVARSDESAGARRACRHLRVRFCTSCVAERRRAQFELEEIAPLHSAQSLSTTLCHGVVGYDSERSSTFSLNQDEMRAHANDLVRSGWSVDEVASVLAIDRRRSV